MPLPRAIGKMVLQGLAGGGLSLTDMVSIARRAGGGYRNAEMMEDARVFSGRAKYEGQVTTLNTNQVIPRGWTNEVELLQGTKYRVHGNMTVFDEESGKYLTQRASFYTDDYAKIGDLQQGFFDHFTGKYQDQNLDITEFEITALEHNKGWDY